jgi:ABC-type multidrug transport system permease subunit
MMGLRTDGGRFGVFLAVLFLVSMTSSSLCVLVSLAVSSVAVANVVALVAILIFLCFGGFLVNGASIPPALRWLPRVSFFTYAFEALMINELHGLTFTFRTVGIGPVISLRGEWRLRVV